MGKKSDHPHEAAFLHEIHRELRVERLQQMWRKYRSLILTMTFCCIILIGGVEIWKQWQARKVAAYALRYDAAIILIDSGHTAEGASMLATIAQEAKGGYQFLATLRLAGVLREENRARALALWRRASADPTVPRPYREASAILTALNGLEILSYDAIYYLLSPLIVEKSPWRFLALEIIAVLALQKEDTIMAHVILTRLVDDLRAPASIRGRASTLRQTLPIFSVGDNKSTQ